MEGVISVLEGKYYKRGEGEKEKEKRKTNKKKSISDKIR